MQRQPGVIMSYHKGKGVKKRTKSLRSLSLSINPMVTTLSISPFMLNISELIKHIDKNGAAPTI